MITSGVATAGTVINNAALIRVPAGPATLLLANAGPAGTVYAGAGTNVSTAGGFPIPSGLVPPVVVPIYAGAPPGTWSVLCAAGGTTSVAWITSDPSGGTGI